MIKRILTPLDGTEIAESGLHWAERAAARCGAAVRLMTVVDPASEDGRERRKQAQAYLRDHKKRLQSLGLSVDAIVVAGPPADTIVEQSAKADLTVATSGTTSCLLSPVLDSVLQNAPGPLVIVRGGRNGPALTAEISKILIALDQSGYSTDIVPAAQELAQALGASILLSHTIEPFGRYRDPAEAPLGVAHALEGERRDATEFVARIAREIAETGTPVEAVITVGDASQEIVRTANRAGAGLIAMATRGRDRLDRWVMSSVANAVLHATQLPCLLLRHNAGA